MTYADDHARRITLDLNYDDLNGMLTGWEIEAAKYRRMLDDPESDDVQRHGARFLLAAVEVRREAFKAAWEAGEDIDPIPAAKIPFHIPEDAGDVYPSESEDVAAATPEQWARSFDQLDLGACPWPVPDSLAEAVADRDPEGVRDCVRYMWGVKDVHALGDELPQWKACVWVLDRLTEGYGE
ncbi:hypothetical protein ACWCYY_18470 [Kitasatospora sp. NPDC001664]